MPLYEWKCQDGCYVETYLTVFQHSGGQVCQQHGHVMEQVIGAPLMVKVKPDIAYDSPIDGTVITSWQARQEDLKRHNCVEYDPEMKRDYERSMDANDRQLEQAVETSVEEVIEKMPTAKRGRLYSELMEQGVDTVYERK
jgi:hypothetical protein